MLIGSVATWLLRDAPCSVFVARAGEWPWPRSIVVGLDGSDASFAAAVATHDVATRTGATVRLLLARGASPADIETEGLTKCGYEIE